ncbi:MAG: hypothetical protein KQ78_01568 [Candidatus Izimaplasma bacterium HR2]|nr:MAG: hypothetical protein KQ78_01568 [Candidatus Izimaplasma bacterium HR2]
MCSDKKNKDLENEYNELDIPKTEEHNEEFGEGLGKTEDGNRAKEIHDEIRSNLDD